MARIKKGAGTGGIDAKRAEKPPASIPSDLEAELSRVVQASPPPDPRLAFPPREKPGPRRYTVLETRRQVRDVEELMIEGADARQIWRVISEPTPRDPSPVHAGITLLRVKALVERVQNDWLSIAKRSEERR